YSERNASGLYDIVTDQIIAMGTDALANIDYTKDYTRHVEDWSKNHRFMDRAGNELRTAIVGEILGPAMGTLLRAHGNYFARDGDAFKPIDDKSKIKDTIALGIPTQASVKMHNIFLNQVIGANQIVTANANEDAHNGRVSLAVLLHSAPFDSVPSEPHPGIPRVATTGKRRLDQVDDEVAGPAGPPADDKLEYTGALTKDIKLGAYYNPCILPDYGGSYFNHSKAKLVQLDVRDTKNELIPPWKFYEALRPGTLVLCLVSLHCFAMVDDSGKERKERKVYQMNAHSIRVLSESDEHVEERTRPIAPNSAERAIAALPKHAAVTSFANFTV
ncbi:hypothetical protein C8F04DRAFT_915583, partial [Mycena alexandri]